MRNIKFSMRTRSANWIPCILLTAFMVLSCVNNKGWKNARLLADRVIEDIKQDRAISHFQGRPFVSDQKMIAESLSVFAGPCQMSRSPGQFVGDFYESNSGNLSSDFVYFLYEYEMPCDSVRFILKYRIDVTPPELVKFYSEPMEAENKMKIN